MMVIFQQQVLDRQEFCMDNKLIIDLGSKSVKGYTTKKDFKAQVARLYDLANTGGC